jgi:hypothetical protein
MIDNIDLVTPVWSFGKGSVVPDDAAVPMVAVSCVGWRRMPAPRRPEATCAKPPSRVGVSGDGA